MQVRFHWRVKDGVVVAPPAKVDVSVVDAEGRPLEQLPGLRLSIRREAPTAPAGSAQPWTREEHAALEYSVPPPGLEPYRLCWRLTLGGTLVDKDDVLVVSKLAAGMRSLALVVLVVGLLASVLATPVLQDVYAFATAALSSFLGVVGFVEGLRTRVLGRLWSPRVSAVATLVMLGVLALIVLGLRLVANLAPEPVSVGGQELQPRVLRLVWGSSSPDQTAYECRPPGTAPALPVGTLAIQAPWTPANLREGPTWLLGWLRWIPRLECVCKASFPPALQKAWREVAECNPVRLHTELDICDAPGARAGVSYVDAKVWEKTVNGASECWRGNGSTLWFDGKRAFEITSKGRDPRDWTRHDPHAVVEPQSLALASSSDLEFHTASGALQGSVRFQRSSMSHVPGCVSIFNEAGMSAVAVSGSAGGAASLHAITLVDDPWRTRELPLCFFREATTVATGVSLELPPVLVPTRMEIVLADGWVPQASGSIQLHSDYLPRLTPPSGRGTVDGLTIRTHQGNWLATLWFSRLAPGRQVLIVPSPSSLGPVADHARVQWEQRGSLERVSGTEVLEVVDGVRFDVPTTTLIGGIAWSVWYAGTGAASAPSASLDFVLEDDGTTLRHQLHLDASSLRIMATPPGACYFTEGLPSSRSCSGARLARRDEEHDLREAAANAHKACSAYYVCAGQP